MTDDLSRVTNVVAKGLCFATGIAASSDEYLEWCSQEVWDLLLAITI